MKRTVRLGLDTSDQRGMGGRGTDDDDSRRHARATHRHKQAHKTPSSPLYDFATKIAPRVPTQPLSRFDGQSAIVCVRLSGGRGRLLLTHVHRASACTLNAVGLLPVSGREDARVAPSCPTTLCVWRNLPYLPYSLPYLTLRLYLLTHAHWALHFECRGAPVVRRGDARVAWPLPYHLVCVERFTLPYLTCT